MELLRYFSLVFRISVALISPILADERYNLPKVFTRCHEHHNDYYLPMPLYIYQSEKLANQLWVDTEMETNKSADSGLEFLSMIIQLPFDFEVFGHNIRKVKVMRKGGIRSADPNLRWSAIPLRIKKFDEFTPCPIRYRLDSSSLTIQWEFGYHNCRNVAKLNFQLKIYAYGRIDFIYKKIPFGNLKNAQFRKIANKFGVSYEFKVPGSNDNIVLSPQLKINQINIKNNTAILIKPLPLCPNHRNKSSCLVDSRNLSPPLSCFWCPAIGICSRKSDFLQNVWRDNGCDPSKISGPERSIKILEDIFMADIANFFVGFLSSVSLYILCKSFDFKTAVRRISRRFTPIQTYKTSCAAFELGDGQSKSVVTLSATQHTLTECRL